MTTYLAVLLSIVSAFAHYPSARSLHTQLNAPWLVEGETFSQAKLRTLINLARTDARTSALVDQAMIALGVQNIADFTKIFNPTSSPLSQGVSEVGGSFSPGAIETRSLELEPNDCFIGAGVLAKEPYQSRIENLKKSLSAYWTRSEVRGCRIQLYFASRPSITLSPEGTWLQCYENFIHELTHFVRFDLFTEPNPVLFERAVDWEQAYLQSPGQEIDARIEGLKAQIRLAGHIPQNSSLPIILADWFTERGEVKANNESFLLVVRDFLGYRGRELWVNRLDFARTNIFLDEVTASFVCRQLGKCESAPFKPYILERQQERAKVEGLIARGQRESGA